MIPELIGDLASESLKLLVLISIPTVGIAAAGTIGSMLLGMMGIQESAASYLFRFVSAVFLLLIFAPKISQAVVEVAMMSLR